MHSPSSAGVIVTVCAVTVPTLSVLPAALTHEPMASAASVAATVWVTLVELESVTLTVFVFGFALELEFGRAFPFVARWNTGPFTFTVSPLTFVTLPVMVAKSVGSP